MSTQRLPDAVRISARGREILIKLKRYTGISQWNTLCRFAYCYSLAIAAEPTRSTEKVDCALEIEWDTFAGPLKTELAAITLWHAQKNAVPAEDMPRYVRSHVERGLGALQQIKSVAELVAIATDDLHSSLSDG
jgi:DNA sulfur modification protein DndE